MMGGEGRQFLTHQLGIRKGSPSKQKKLKGNLALTLAFQTLFPRVCVSVSVEIRG